MFTGLVESMGTVRRVVPDGTGGVWLEITESPVLAQLGIGESVAVNGCCLTVVERSTDSCHFQAGPETLQRTNLGQLQTGAVVNLERALRLGDRLGGHLVQGHIDGVGTIAERIPSGDWEIVWFACPPELAAYMVYKGSIAVDGVSLTLVDVQDDRFSVMLIPHTRAMTTLGRKQVGDLVNLEVDLMARYVQKMLANLHLRGEGQPT